MIKTIVKFQKDRPKTVEVVALTSTTNWEPRTTESRKQCPPPCRRKGGGQKQHNFKIPRAHAYPQTTSKTPVKFQTD